MKLIVICFVLAGCTTVTKVAVGHNIPYTENVITQYKGILADGRTAIVSTGEYESIVAHIREVDALNNKVYYSDDNGMYQMPPVETEIWRTYKGTVWSPYKTETVTKQRFIQTDRAKGKFSIAKTLLLPLAFCIVSATGNLVIDEGPVHPAAGVGIGFGSAVLINMLFQDVKIWNVEGITFW